MIELANLVVAWRDLTREYHAMKAQHTYLHRFRICFRPVIINLYPKWLLIDLKLHWRTVGVQINLLVTPTFAHHVNSNHILPSHHSPAYSDVTLTSLDVTASRLIAVFYFFVAQSGGKRDNCHIWRTFDRLAGIKGGNESFIIWYYWSHIFQLRTLWKKLCIISVICCLNELNVHSRVTTIQLYVKICN